jgi:hypothetical protein
LDHQTSPSLSHDRDEYLETLVGLSPRADPSSGTVERTMGSRSLIVLVAALLLVLTIVVFFAVLADYLFQPMLVQ